MKIAFALIHVLALGTCFVVQLGAPEVSRVPGVRRALQTLEENSAVRERISRETRTADRCDDDGPIEQTAFSPGNTVPGVGLSPNKMLRCFAPFGRRVRYSAATSREFQLASLERISHITTPHFGLAG